jgi:hypothetical protein
MSAAERMRRMRARRKAAGLRAVTTWKPATGTHARGSTHRLHDARSLAMHVVVARRIEHDRTLLARARRTLQRWERQQGHPVAPWLTEWQELLAQPWPVIADRITALDEDATRLRQSSPLTVLLSQDDRKRIREAFGA